MTEFFIAVGQWTFSNGPALLACLLLLAGAVLVGSTVRDREQ